MGFPCFGTVYIKKRRGYDSVNHENQLYTGWAWQAGGGNRAHLRHETGSDAQSTLLTYCFFACLHSNINLLVHESLEWRFFLHSIFSK